MLKILMTSGFRLLSGVQAPAVLPSSCSQILTHKRHFMLQPKFMLKPNCVQIDPKTESCLVPTAEKLNSPTFLSSSSSCTCLTVVLHQDVRTKIGRSLASAHSCKNAILRLSAIFIDWACKRTSRPASSTWPSICHATKFDQPSPVTIVQVRT